MKPHPHGQQILVVSLLAFLGLLIYANTLEAPFHFDDRDNIVKNRHIRISKPTLNNLAKAGFNSPSSNRPIANISFALNYYIHHHSAAGYHIINIVIHISTGILLYLFIRITLSLPALRFKYARSTSIASFTALVWLAHPIQIESVTYVVQRMNSLAAMFYVLSLLLYVKGRIAKKSRESHLLFAGSALSGIMALGCKEIAATLPFFMILYEWYFLRDLSKEWMRRRLGYCIGAFVLLSVLVFLYLGLNPLEKLLSLYERRDFTLNERLLTEFRVVVYYVSLLLYPNPSRLNLDHDFEISRSLVDPLTTSASAGVLVGLIGLAWYLARRERVISFCIIWFLGNLVIESSVVGLEIMFEHRTYLPSMLFVLAIVTLLHHPMMRERLRIWTLCTIIACFSLWTYERNLVWSDPVTLWKDCVQKAGEKARPHYNLGYFLGREGRIDEAISHYNEALRIKPDYGNAHNNLGNALAGQGKFDEAIVHLTEAVRLDPHDPKPLWNLGSALADQGSLDEAIPYFSKAFLLTSDGAEAHNKLGAVLAKYGKHDKAIQHYNEALRAEPSYDSAHYNLGVALAQKGDLNGATAHYHEALKINPDNPEAHNNLGKIAYEQGNAHKAISYYQTALRIDPGNAKVHYNLGAILDEQGKQDEAIAHYQKALRSKSDFAEAHNNLGIILIRQKRLDEALYHYSEAIRIKPGYLEARNNLGVALIKQGNLDGAAARFREILRLDPENKAARNNLEFVSRITD